VDNAKSQKKKATKDHLEKRSGERKVDSRFSWRKMKAAAQETA